MLCKCASFYNPIRQKNHVKIENSCTKPNVSKCSFLIIYHFSDNCYTLRTEHSAMPYSLEALESVPVQAMEDKQCETFLKRKTKELHRDIVCAPDYGLNLELDHFKVAAQ